MLSKAERSVRLLRAVSWCRRLLLRSTIYAQSFSNSKVVFVRAIRRIRFFKTIALTVAALIACSAPAFSKTCESLASVNLQDVAIKSAVSISAGSYQPPGSGTSYADLPAFCRVVGTVQRALDSSIGFEVWLPTSDWNGRYQQVGNHGFSGVIYWGEMAPQLRRGFAAGATDDGHIASGTSPFDVSWAYGHPAKIEDWTTQAVHQLAQKAKLLITAFYGKPLRASYFNGCSNGGRQGIKEAQDFPDDFDGILAGGAALHATQGATEQLIMSLNLQRTGIQGERGKTILELALAAATKACDRLDGVADGIVGNPTRCHWDPHDLICKTGTTSSDCITTAQADALAENMRDVTDPVTREWVFSGMPPGSEFNQISFQYELGPAPFGLSNYRIATNNPSWDGSSFNLHADLPKLNSALGAANALNPDLNKFAAHGGKLIQYHDWDDAAFTPGGTIKYYNDVVKTVGHGDIAKVQRFYRLFMVPGVGHCAGGPGPNNFGEEGQQAVSDDAEHDAVTALMRWVEKDQAPEKLIATKFIADDPKQGIKMQRPLFPYPAEAVWNGRGDTNKAENFHMSAGATPAAEVSKD